MFIIDIAIDMEGQTLFARHQLSINHDGTIEGPNQVTIFDFLHGEMEPYTLKNLTLYIVVNANEKSKSWSSNIILYHTILYILRNQLSDILFQDICGIYYANIP